MRTVIQRVTEASVIVNGETVGSIGRGLLVFLGVAGGDAREDADYLMDKVAGLRIFPDEAGKMNCNLTEAGGSVLVVSQFTLYGDCRRGRRPSFDRAAPPQQAQELYNYFVEGMKKRSVATQTGVFQAKMEVRLVNDGPVTIWIDSEERNGK